MAALVEALNALADALEAPVLHFDEARKRSYYYDEVNVKRWITDGDPCEICESNEELGWIDDDATFESVFGDIDDGEAHPHCFSGRTTVSAANVSCATRREFEGEINILRIPGVDDISVTPNHPILTCRGWRPAGSLKAGDYLAQAIRPSEFSIFLDPHNHHVETSIEQIANTLFMSSGMSAHRVPIATEAFHGDVGTEREVDIVWATGALTNHGLNRIENAPHHRLCSRHTGLIAFSGKGSLFEIRKRPLHASNSIMGSGAATLPLFRGGFAHHDDSRVSLTSLFQTKRAPSRQNTASRYADAIGNVKQAFASQMRLVQLTGVERREFSGHVYNLETRWGFYTANSIIAHNCMCQVEYGTQRKRVYV